MKKPARAGTSFTLALLMTAGVLSSTGVRADETAVQADSVGEAFTKGQAAINFRYRFESVDQDGISICADAICCNRSLISVFSGLWGRYSRTGSFCGTDRENSFSST